jgi:hypothetical protein
MESHLAPALNARDRRDVRARRHCRTELAAQGMPLPGHPIPGSHRARMGTMAHTMETRLQRFATTFEGRITPQYHQLTDARPVTPKIGQSTSGGRGMVRGYLLSGAVGPVSLG